MFCEFPINLSVKQIHGSKTEAILTLSSMKERFYSLEVEPPEHQVFPKGELDKYNWL